MVYVLDTNIFREIIEHFPKEGKMFQKIIGIFEDEIEAGTIISVDECYNELEKHYSNDASIIKQLKLKRKIFQNPTNAESLTIKNIFSCNKFCENIRKKNILDGRPAADVYIAAKAKALKGIVVTREKYKKNSAQLPNICEYLKVKCITYDDFMNILTSKM